MIVTEDTQTRLLDAAGRVFAEKGFRSATVREIVARAGLQNVAAVNYYFRDKQSLYEAALRWACTSRIEHADFPSWPPGTPASAKLRDFITVVLRRLVEDAVQPWQMQLMMQELARPTPAFSDLVRDFTRPFYDMLWHILREAMPAGVCERDVHLVGFSIVGQCLYHRMSRHVVGLVVGVEQETYTVELLADHISRFTLSALHLDPGEPTPQPPESKVPVLTEARQ
jgi:AcrR family transcriptional regulator